ncbi:hypothetical protein [Streptomyces sp. SID5910]|uniref:hypothetical protein n=1 Tax=Streptomyces sp. SID5910 TaxID=2690312 RepID=UPI0013712EDC|nr:hypothetical protein [Streptomyces sp. SID5910]MYR45065.1 hypothetical protein [Streptomyces sp. SID5910]
MGWFSRAQSSRDYPAAGRSISGDAGRFRRHKTSGARRAARDGQAWEDRDRASERRSGWYRSAR